MRFTTDTLRRVRAAAVAAIVLTGCAAPGVAPQSANPALEWNAVFIDTLVAANTPNAVSQRLGAIVHSAMFDACNGIRQEYVPIHHAQAASDGTDEKAATIAAAYTTLTALFPARRTELDARYAASLAAWADGRDAARRQRGIEYGTAVARAVLAWRAADGFSASLPAFTGGTAPGQWRPTPPAFAPMSAQSVAATQPFVLDSATRFRPAPPRGVASRVYADDFSAVKALGRRTGSTRTEDQTALALMWEGNATVHWNQAANQMARARGLDLPRSARLLALLNVAMADTGITAWAAKRYYGEDRTAVTWRPVTAIAAAVTDDHPGMAQEADWLPLINTPSHPEYPAGHPSLNGAAATVILSEFNDAQVFTLTTPNLPDRTYTSISQARKDGNSARVWGGMHYPSTVAVSDAMGAAVADYVLTNAMQRRQSR